MRPTQTPFQRHLSFFDHNHDGVIAPSDSLRAALSIGCDFPVACVWAFIVPLLYGNSGPLSSAVHVPSIPASKRRTMLENYPVTQPTYSRGDLTQIASKETNNWVDWLHVFNLWTLAADSRTGLVSKRDFELFQKGELLEELKRRRRVRRPDGANVLPFVRGGPIWVGGHSMFVGLLFGVEVYKQGNERGE